MSSSIVRAFLTFTLVCSAFCISASAQFSAAPAQPFRISPYAQLNQQPQLTWAQKMFDHQKIDFGVIARGSEAVFRLKITNLYKENVHISNVRTTCGCSAASPDRTTLKSHESAYIKVTMDTQKFSRRKDSNVIVTFDRPLYAEVRIPITSYIRPDVVLDPGSVEFGDVIYGSTSVKELEVRYAGRGDWQIRSIENSNEHLDVRFVETERTQNLSTARVHYKLQVSLKATAPVGQFREQIYLITDDDGNPRVPLLVEAKVTSDMTITPEVIALGSVAPGDVKTFNVVLRGKKPFSIDKVECTSRKYEFNAKVPGSASPVQVLPMTITMPTRQGDFSEIFAVSIAGRPAPVHFRAYGQVVGN